MSKKKISCFEKYLTEEIGVEFKACLYFFCILFFYAMYRVLNGNFEASIVHMAEMILLTYGMCYVQLYFMNNFDEGERFARPKSRWRAHDCSQSTLRSCRPSRVAPHRHSAQTWRDGP